MFRKPPIKRPIPQGPILPGRIPQGTRIQETYIEPGHTLQEREDYAEKIKNVAAYYYEGANWKGGSPEYQSRPDVVLVEVWKSVKLGEVVIHPARNPFFRVLDNRQKAIWHDLATNPKTETKRKHHTVHQTGPSAPAAHQQAGSSPKIPPKPSVAPLVWAEAENVIGYTSKEPIDNPTFDSLSDLPSLGRALPSVYYHYGHKTNDHKELNNIGWDDKSGWQCLFFGNVPRVFAQKP